MLSRIELQVGWLVLLFRWLCVVVVVVVVVVFGVVVGVVCVWCGVWFDTLKKTRVYIQHVLVRTGTTPACVSTFGRGAGTHGDV